MKNLILEHISYSNCSCNIIYVNILQNPNLRSLKSTYGISLYPGNKSLTPNVRLLLVLSCAQILFEYFLRCHLCNFSRIIFFLFLLPPIPSDFILEAADCSTIKRWSLCVQIKTSRLYTSDFSLFAFFCCIFEMLMYDHNRSFTIFFGSLRFKGLK